MVSSASQVSKSVPILCTTPQEALKHIGHTAGPAVHIRWSATASANPHPLLPTLNPGTCCKPHHHWMKQAIVRECTFVTVCHAVGNKQSPPPITCCLLLLSYPPPTTAPHTHNGKDVVGHLAIHVLIQASRPSPEPVITAHDTYHLAIPVSEQATGVRVLLPLNRLQLLVGPARESKATSAIRGPGKCHHSSIEDGGNNIICKAFAQDDPSTCCQKPAAA